jgi:Diacylglycerol acyltransferase
MTTTMNDQIQVAQQYLMSVVNYIRHEYSKESDKDWKNTIILLGTSSILLLLALAFGRQLFHSSSAYYALLHRGEEQDIIHATTKPKKTPTKAEEKEKDATSATTPATPPSKPSLVRRDSTDIQVPIVGFVSFSSTWERRKQTFAMFTCSLAFVMPMTLFCWMVTIYLAVVVPLQHRTVSAQQHERQQEMDLFSHIPMLLSSVVWIYLLYVYLLDHAQTMGNRKPWMRGTYRGWTGHLLRQWWSLACDFLPVILVKTAPLPATTTTFKDGKMVQKVNKYVLGYHPHGIIAVGAFCAFSTDGVRVLDLSKSESTISNESENDNANDADNLSTSSAFFSTPDRRGFSSLFPGLDRRVVTLPQNFWTPFLREYFLR